MGWPAVVHETKGGPSLFFFFLKILPPKIFFFGPRGGLYILFVAKRKKTRFLFFS